MQMISPSESSAPLSPPEPGRRERKRQQQLDTIADIAWNLFLVEGFAPVTMERIAEAADVSKVTLYRHFPVKEALLRHVFHRELRAAWPAIRSELERSPPGRARLARFLQLQGAWCEHHRTFLPPYVRYRLADTRLPSEGRERSGLDEMFAELISQGQAIGEFRTDVPAALMAMHLQFMHLATLLRCLADDSLSLPDEMAGMLDLACDGMAVRA